MGGATPERLADIGEEDLLARIFPLFGIEQDASLPVGPGDDAAVLSVPDGRVVATTDAMVRGSDWLDHWSSGADVGVKCVAQNVADVAAMGARPTGLLLTLAAEPDTRVDWALDLARGIAQAAREFGCRVIGGDLSGAPEGLLLVSITALGDLEGRAPVRRDGARPGDVVAVAGSLGRAAAGLLALERGAGDAAPDLVAAQRRPHPPVAEGPRAAELGAHAMIDLSDGLVRDAGRVARASGVTVDLSSAALAADVDALVDAGHGVLTSHDARGCVFGGGEEHSLLAVFPPDVALPGPWRPVGRIVARSGADPTLRSGVTVDGDPVDVQGWDHFGG